MVFKFSWVFAAVMMLGCVHPEMHSDAYCRVIEVKETSPGKFGLQVARNPPSSQDTWCFCHQAKRICQDANYPAFRVSNGDFLNWGIFRTVGDVDCLLPSDIESARPSIRVGSFCPNTSSY